MPTYEYECESCGVRFDRRQSILEAPIADCPECSGRVRRVISGGSGFILKGSASGREQPACFLDPTGRSCCGRDERCGKLPCEAD